MSAITAPLETGNAHTAPNGLARVLRVVKLHFVNATGVVWMPLMIFAAIFLVNWALWLLITLSAGSEGLERGTSWSGASSFIFVYMLVVAVQAMNLTFSFALGLGSTRRDYALGTGVAFLGLAAVWAVILGVMAWLEELTNGWWLGGRMFAAIYFGDDGSLARTWYVFLIFLFFMALGAVAGALWLRWKQWGLLTFGVSMAAVIIGALAIIGLNQAWPQVGEFFMRVGWAGGYPLLLIPTVIASVIAFLLLRRAPART